LSGFLITIFVIGVAMNNSTGGSVAAARLNDDQLHENAGKYLTFRLAEEEYGLAILKVKEIIGLLSITHMPRTPQHIRGIINLRGRVIPVMDLRVKFGMEATEDTSETCIIVVDISRRNRTVHMGILVDSVSEVLDIAASEIEDSPKFGDGVDTDFIKGMGKTRDRVIMLLDIDKVVVGDDLALAVEAAESSN
jgi:purine-binding chemotaxis protein CheW